MRRLAILAIFLMTAILGSTLVRAQDSWFLYIYNAESGALIRLAANGNQVVYGLPAELDQIAFNADGTLAAYQIGRTLTIRDIAANADRFTLDFPPSLVLNGQNFSDDGQSLVVASQSTIWDRLNGQAVAQLSRIDLATGEIVHHLETEMLARVELVGTEGMVFSIGRQQYAWIFENTEASPTSNAPADWSPIVSNLPDGSATLRMSESDLWLQDATGERIIYEAETTIRDAQFINNGRDIAIRVSNDVWIRLGRDGSTSPLQIGTDAPIRAAPFGYVLLRINNFDPPEARIEHYIGDELFIIWEDASGAWDVVWSAPTFMDLDLPTFE